MDQPNLCRADPKTRRRTALLLIVTGLVGGGLLYLLNQHLRNILTLAEMDPEAALGQARQLVMGIACAGTAGFLGAALWFWRLARHIRRSDQYPPPGTKALRDTPVATGAHAWTIATKFNVVAVLTALLGTSATWYLWWIAADKLGR